MINGGPEKKPTQVGHFNWCFKVDVNQSKEVDWSSSPMYPADFEQNMYHK